MEELVFALVTMSILLFLLYKPRVGLKLTVLNNALWNRIFGIKHLACPEVWRFIGIDEKDSILPDGEKRFRIFVAIFTSVWIMVLVLIAIS